MRPFAFFSLLARSTNQPIAKKLRPGMEVLEDRSIPSVNTISGFVYEDINSNGLRDVGELAIANSSIELRDDQGVVIASTTTDENGYYEFMRDQTIIQEPQSLTHEVVFPPTQTNFDLQGALQQFDPQLGELQSVEITYEGAISSTIKVENTSPSSSSTITGEVGGTLTISAPNAAETLTLEENAGAFDAGIFDGTIDFTGASGNNFGLKEATGTKSVTLTGPAMNPYKGTGQVAVQAEAEASSFATGGGNLVVDLNSSAHAKVTVKYNYVPSPGLKPGNYLLVQTAQPPGYGDGKESAGGIALNTPPGADEIPVTLNDQDVPNNNFGEHLTLAKISGHVFEDDNNNGQLDAGEKGIGNATLTLTGTDDLGPVQRTIQTSATGFYEFNALRPGNYQLNETQPDGYLDGKESAGTLGGSVSANDQISGIVVQVGASGQDYDFGELKAASLSGHVYHDANDNGLRESGETGIPGATVTLTGSDDVGAIQVVATTDASGHYAFNNLRAGIYTVTETQPVGWKDGKDKAGRLGGNVGDDVISSIIVGVGAAGIDYDFGEKEPDESDLAIVKRASAQSVLVGSLLGYTLTITNNGPGAAIDVSVVDHLPAGVVLVEATGEGWTIAAENDIILASRPLLANGEVSVIHVTIQAPVVEGNLFNATEVTSTTPDKDPSNNKSTVTTPVVNNPGNLFAKTVTPLGTPVPRSKVDLLVGPGAPGPDNRATFVDGTIRTLLGRAATAQELDYYINQIGSGVSREQIVAGLWNSDAHLQSQANRLYSAYLDRTATSDEQTQMVQVLRTQSETDAIVGLLTSDEYLQTHPGTHGLVAGLHADIYGKLPDTSSLLISAQAANNTPLETFARNMLTSAQGTANLVDQAYHLALRRPANASEIGYWSTQMQSGLSQGQLIQNLLAGGEFYQLTFDAAR